MTTKKQLARLFRAVVKRNPDWVQVNPYAIWIHPVRHCIAQIYIYRGRSADVFWPRFSITPLYWGGANWDWKVGSFSEGFSREPRPAPFTREYFLQPDFERRPEFSQHRAWAATVRDFEWADPEIDRIFTRAVEEQVLPLLRPMALDHHAYLDFYRSHIVPSLGLYDQQRMAIALAAGALDEAREFLGRIWRWYESDTYGDYEPPETLDYPKRGAPSRPGRRPAGAPTTGAAAAASSRSSSRCAPVTVRPSRRSSTAGRLRRRASTRSSAGGNRRRFPSRRGWPEGPTLRFGGDLASAKTLEFRASTR